MYKKIEGHPTCLECGKEIYGRPEKKYCCEECKNKHNYRLSNEFRKYRNKVIMGLNTNYRLLSSIIKAGGTSADLDDLTLAGFKPNLITGLRPGRHTKQEYSCFDIRYTQSESRLYNIRRTKGLSPGQKPFED